MGHGGHEEGVPLGPESVDIAGWKAVVCDALEGGVGLFEVGSVVVMIGSGLLRVSTIEL